jgi:uncharacterized protein YndB with AHSA1/START domain
MRENKVTVIIDKPIDEVFEFTTNPKNTHLWVPFISEEISSEYPPKIGTIYRSCRENDSWSEMKVVEFYNNKKFVISDLDENLFVKYVYRELNENSTELEYSDWMIDKDFHSPITKDVLENLKKVMEG